MVVIMMKFILLSMVMSVFLHCNFLNKSNPVKKPEFPVENCQLKPDPGPCRARMDGFFYNKDSKSCQKFIYGGCQGTLPFAKLEDCESTCR